LIDQRIERSISGARSEPAVKHLLLDMGIVDFEPLM
jgi:hypothetical protein